MKTKDFIIRVLRKTYCAITRKRFYAPMCDCNRQSSNDKIYNILSTGKPCMIARFGTVEINCINNYLCVNSHQSYIRRIINFIVDKTHTPWWYENVINALYNNAGVFPKEVDVAEKLSERYLKDIPEIDMLACHQYYEKFMPLKDDIERVQLEMLYPFFVDRPWTRILKGKKVLVIHPFEETIREQYKKRELLFTNTDILPDFELITMKAVQTIAGNKSEFKDWFDALSFMENRINKIDFDIAFVGCGAYGLPLAAHIKRLGKQAIHLAGGTQLLFGIIGNRWSVDYKNKGTWHYLPGIDINIDYTPLFNENWIYPLSVDTPQNAKAVEGACYWK